MHKSRLAAIGIDCRDGDLESHARFWGAALGLKSKEPDEDGRFVNFEDEPGQPQVFVQRVEHEPRVHLDIETDDIEAEVKRLERLGATVVARIKSWVVMQAPSGQRFCVVTPHRADFAEGARTVE